MNNLQTNRVENDEDSTPNNIKNANSGKKTLRPYQKAVLSELGLKFQKKQSTLIQMPTGSGKTPIALYLFKILGKKMRVFFVVHRKELVEQVSEGASREGLEHGYICSERTEKPNRYIQICMIQTFVNKLNYFDEDEKCVFIWDECHHIVAKTYTKAFQYFKNSIHIGLTATPFRRDGVGFTNYFQEIITLDSVINNHFDSNYTKSSVRWLIDKGHLSDYKLYAIPSIVRDDISIVNGVFDNKESEAALGSKEIIGQIVNTWKKRAGGLKTIAFAVNVSHAMNMTQAFQESGVSATYVTGDTKEKHTRATKLMDFATGVYDVLINVALFDEGFDISSASGLDVCVKCVILASPTHSLAKYLQMVGRALRTSSCGQKAIILDHAQNSFKDTDEEVHGFPDKKRNWTLEGFLDEPAIIYKTCRACFYRFKSTFKNCPECGTKYIARKRKADNSVYEDDNLEIQEVTEELIQAKRKEVKRKLYNATTVREVRQIKKMDKDEALVVLRTNSMKKGIISNILKLVDIGLNIYGKKISLDPDLFLKNTDELRTIENQCSQQISSS